MKQTKDLSMSAAGMVTDVVTGVVTLVTSARRLYYCNRLLVAIVVLGVMFAIVDLFRNHLSGVSAPQAQGDISAPSPASSRLPKPTPRASKDAAVLFRNHLSDDSAPQAQGEISAPAPASSRLPEPAPLTREDAEVLRRQIRPNKM